ncbi:MAG: hypothetical protein Q7S17_04765 [Xanthobacteraceae bacterium]|nr:hypothetical protein [Xanthobacteraceae bacterium]
MGLACAKRFVVEGTNVVLADIDAQEGALAAKHLGDSARFLRCDVGTLRVPILQSPNPARPWRRHFPPTRRVRGESAGS